MINNNEPLEEWQKCYLDDTLGFASLIKELNDLFELFVIFNEEEHSVDYYWVMN